MADVIGQEAWSADGKSYVIKVTEPGATVTENAIRIVSPIRLRRGDVNYDALEPVLESQLSFTIRDSSKLFRQAITGKQAGDIQIEFTEDGNVLFKGYVVPEYERRLAYLNNPLQQVTATCGINLLQGFTFDQVGKQTVREQIFAIADKIGLTLPLDIFFEDKELSAKAEPEPPDALRFRVEQLLDDGSYYDALKTLCEFYNAQFFQSAGTWQFMQRSLRGGALTRRPTGSAGVAGAAESVDYLFAVSDSSAHRDGTYLYDWPAKARIESVHLLPSYGLRNGDFTQGSRFWRALSGSSVDNKWEIDTHEDYIEQEVGYTFRITSATLDRIKVHARLEVDINPSSSGTGIIRWAEVFAEDEQNNKRWLDDTGAWQSTQQYLTYGGVDLTAGAGTSVAIDDAAQASLIMPFEPMRVTVRLTHFNGSEATNPNQIINATRFAEAWITHITPEPEDDINRPEEFVYAQETGQPGEAVSHEFQIGDWSDAFIAPGVMEYFTALDDWRPTNSWDVAGRTYHEKRMLARHGQISERLKAIEVSHKFGDDPDLHNAITFDDDGDAIADVYVPTFIEKIYRRNAKVYVRSAGKELRKPPAPVSIFMVGADDHFYTMRADFTEETNTGLDLSSYSIIDIAFNQVNEMVYGLASDGKVYEWDTQGAVITEKFDTGFTDFTAISIDNVNQHIVLSNHRAGTFNDFTYAYSIAGFQQWSWENRSGLSMLSTTKFVSGGKGYAYITDTGGSGNNKNLYRMDISDGSVEFLQNVIIFGSEGAQAFDEVSGAMYKSIINNLYLYSTEVANNLVQAIFVTSHPANKSNALSYFEYEANSYIVGCSASSLLWSYRIGDASGVYNETRTSNNMRLVTTRQPFTEV